MNDHDLARRYKESSVDPHRHLNKLVGEYIHSTVSYVYLIKLVYVGMARFCFSRAGIFLGRGWAEYMGMGCGECDGKGRGREERPKFF